jgi:hypothetical protein
LPVVPFIDSNLFGGFRNLYLRSNKIIVAEQKSRPDFDTVKQMGKEDP